MFLMSNGGGIIAKFGLGGDLWWFCCGADAFITRPSILFSGVKFRIGILPCRRPGLLDHHTYLDCVYFLKMRSQNLNNFYKCVLRTFLRTL